MSDLHTDDPAVKARTPLERLLPCEKQLDLFTSGADASPIIFNGPAELGRLCQRCGGESFLSGPGAGPHAARLTCIACGRFAGWLSKTKLAELLQRTGA
jgi:hypothetical protein